jgi:ABC-2 type transport system permease protein
MSVADVARADITGQAPRKRLVSSRLLRSEVRLIGGRRRNQMGLLVLALVPIVLAISVKVSSGNARGGPDFLDSVTSNGLFVPLAALAVEMGIFLPLAISMLAGDAVAGEANLGTLRYLLTVPVSRTRLLVVKYASLCIGALWGVATVAVAGAVIGVALFGTGPLTTLSGSQLEFPAALGRVLLVVLYLSACIAALGAVGLFISTLTEQPIAATIALMIFTILSWILDAVPQLQWLHPWLIVHEWLSFADLLRDPPYWDNILRNLGLQAAYLVVFYLLAWARLTSRDISG